MTSTHAAISVSCHPSRLTTRPQDAPPTMSRPSNTKHRQTSEAATRYLFMPPCCRLSDGTPC
jgi:hypothetical protein